MGKVKRVRQKYHLAKVKSMNDLTTIEPNPGAETQRFNSSLPTITVATNLFANIDIPLNFDRPLRTEQDIFDDAKSIVSTKSSFKDRNLTKKQKRTMRHDAFVRKLDVISQARKEIAERKKQQKRKGKSAHAEPMLPPAEPSLPAEQPFFNQQSFITAQSFVEEQSFVSPKANKLAQEPKKKSLLKAKQRQRQTLKDIGTFKKVMDDPGYRADPLAAISSIIHDKIRRELEDE